MISTALQFSGGKDSLATLHWWGEHYGLDDTVVMWVNTGLAYPEVIECMERTVRAVPHFLEIKTDAEGDMRRHGYPSDVVPINSTRLGKTLCVSADTGVTVQPWLSCCSHNLWEPLDEAVRRLKIYRVVRGQRIEETQKSPLRDGYVDPTTGIEYRMPIERWSTAEVFAYLRKHRIDIPSYYEREHTSRDCWSCTAFLWNGGAERIRSLPDERRSIVTSRLREIKRAVDSQAAFMEAV